MKKQPEVDFLSLPRDGHLNVRVPTAWRAKVEADWKAAQKGPGGERFRTFTDYVIAVLAGQR